MIDIETRGKEIVDWLQNEYAGIRTGQATPALLDSIKVENYGSMMPLNQVGSVGVEDARTLRIAPWDVGSIGAIETAIRDADLGVSVSTDSAGLRVSFPELTSDRRARESVQKIVDTINKQLEEIYTKKEQEVAQ